MWDLRHDTAQAILDLDFDPADRRRMHKLAEKANPGTLTRLEREDAATYNRVAHLLALLQSEARRSLRTGKRR